jgi:hypothetical protein
MPKHEYVRVVEAYRQRGKMRHRTVLKLGRRDLLAAHLDLNKLTRVLHGDAASDDMRPIYHQTDNRVQAHIYVAALALLIDREKKLKAARLDLSAPDP